ncbi:MAG: HlyC/CorC family transporter [Chloroflexi bacterium]|nr:HlyC/CorC family transporter [Chloroflexota bacterium]
MEGINGLYLVLFLVSLGLAALFCSAETAFISLQRFHLQHLIHNGHPNAKIAAKIMEKPEKFLSTVLLAINFFETAVAALGTVIAVSLWGENLGAAIATIIVTILTLVFAEVIPKNIALRYGEKIALSYARPIQLMSWLLTPFVVALSWIAFSATKLIGGTPTPRSLVSEEEIRTMISVGHREGTVEKEAAEMLHNVFDFGDRTAREVMVPRREVVFIERGTKIADFLAVYAQHPLSRFPVYQDRRDNVVGILSVKDVLMAQAKGTINDETTIDDFLRPANFAPESKLLSDLFIEMRNRNCHLSVVVDEFGSTAGIVTLTRLVEEIVGPVGDELTAVEKEYEIINDYTFQIDGGMRVEEANEEIGLELPEGDYETVAGFILYLLRRIPRQGEQLRYKDLKLVITKMQGMKIEEVLVTKEKSTTASHETTTKKPKEKNATPAD